MVMCLGPVAPLTDRAAELGFYIPPGWAVTATAGTENFHPRENYFTDEEWLSFWCGDWSFVTVTVLVTDEHDRTLFTQRLAHCEHGDYPVADDTGQHWAIERVNALDPYRPYMADLITQTMLGAYSYHQARLMSEQ